MKKFFFALMAMVASGAWAQQNVDITAEQFNSGAANAELTTLGRQAATSGKRLVVTAPQHWHAQIAARIRAGGDAEIVLKDGFYETLLVRVEDKAAEPAKPEPKPEPAAVAAAAKPAPAPVAAVPKPAPVVQPPKAEAPPPPPVQVVIETPAPAPEPVVEAPPPKQEPAPPAPVEEAPVPAPAAAVAVDPKAPIMLVSAEPGDTDQVRESLEKRYNDGKRIIERVEPTSLREGDVIYTSIGAAVVVRRENNRMIRMWLVGPLNLNQTGLRSDGLNKYHVVNSDLAQ